MALPHGSWGSLKYSSLWAPSTSRPSNIHTYLSFVMQTQPPDKSPPPTLPSNHTPKSLSYRNSKETLELWSLKATRAWFPYHPKAGSHAHPQTLTLFHRKLFLQDLVKFSTHKKSAYKANSKRSREHLIFWPLSLGFQHHSEFLGTNSFGNWGGVVGKCISLISNYRKHMTKGLAAVLSDSSPHLH